VSLQAVAVAIVEAAWIKAVEHVEQNWRANLI